MNEICIKEKCSGCGACMLSCIHSAISWLIDDEGFKYPTIDQEKCIDCGSCAKKCPNNKEYQPELFEKKVFAAYSKQWQTQGSSGGLFSAFAANVLTNGGKVYGAAYHNNLLLKQTGIVSINDIGKLQGSKYSQSDTADTYKEVKTDLQEGKSVLYCGTPCQIAGLLNVIPDRLKTNLFTIDLVCHGVPSQKAFDKLIYSLQNKYGIVTDFFFRLMKYQAIAPHVVVEGKKHYLKDDDYIYMNAFYKGLLFRSSCYNCQFSSTIRPADITLADFWRIKGFKGKKRHNGVSMVIINTQKGEHFFQGISSELYYEERNLNYAVSEQHNLKVPSPRPEQRDCSVKDFLELELHEFGIKYKLLPKNKMFENIKFALKIFSLKLGVFKYLNKK